MKREIKKPKKIKRRTTPLQLAGVFAIIVGTILGSVVLLQQSRAIPQENIVAVAAAHDIISLPVPTRSVQPGEKLSQIPFTIIDLPQHRFSSEYIKSFQEFPNAHTKTALPKLLPIPLDGITSEQVEHNLVVEGIPEGMRAITVKVDSESSVEGWAQSGSYVDVILIRSAADSESGIESKIIAENVRILSAGQSTEPVGTRNTAPRAPATVTLLTSQEDALKIKTAVNLGRLTFALRGIGDEQPSQVLAMSHKKLLGANTAKGLPRYTGYARDAQGKLYVLTPEKEWIRSEEQSLSINNSDDPRVSQEARAKLRTPNEP